MYSIRGYTMLTGVYMEPGKAYVTYESAIMETDEEYEKMREMIMAYDYKIFCEEHRKELDTLINRLGCIPEGVTCHENEHYDNVFSNLLSTQFYWHIQDMSALSRRMVR